MAFDPTNPFGFNDWLHLHGFGGTDTGDDVELGQENLADPNDTTAISVVAADNAALVGRNREPNHGAVGVFCISDSCQSYGIGAVGFCPVGVGVYGISQTGLGVVGRVVENDELEGDPLEVLAPRVGVFGQAVGGVGVRGHGGPGLGRPSPADERRPRTIGGVFSAGELQDAHIPGATGVHEVSVTPFAQMQLIPSQSDTLPADGRLGDLFLALRGDLPARLFICTKLSGGAPMWQEVQMQSSFLPSGSPI